MLDICLPRYVIISLLAIVAVGALAAPARADTTLEDCYVRSDDSQLAIGNSLIERTFSVQGECLNTVSIGGGDVQFTVEIHNTSGSLDLNIDIFAKSHTILSLYQNDSRGG